MASSAAASGPPLTPSRDFPATPITPKANTHVGNSHAPLSPQTGASIASPKYDVTTFGFDQARTGKNTAESTLGVANVGQLQQQWTTGFAVAGAFDATPVGASNVSTPSGTHDLIYVGNEGGGFGAIDATTGAVVWQANVGQTTTSCGALPGGIAGVSGAAVIDRTANRVYVAGGTGFLFGFDMGTGQQVSSWKMTSFPALKHVWGGLQLDAGRHLLYAALGSVGCDATPYQGQLLAFNTSTGSHQTFTVMASAQNGGGIWGWGGASLDANGNPFVATGNGLPNGPGEANLYAERVIKLSAGNMSILGYNHPTTVSGGKDLDFGATPTIMDVPGCGIPRVAANNKNGHQYIWNRNNLNAGPIEDLTIAGNSGSQHLQGLPAYDPTTGQMFTTVPTSGPTYQHGIMSRTFGQTSAGCRTQATWAQTAGPTSSPVSSPTLANGVVYYADGQGKAVHAFNARNGSPLWSSAAGDLGGSAFSAPTVFNGVLYVSSRDGTLHAYAINDFSISANPTSLSLAQGAAGSSTISTAVVSGSPQTVNLSISGLPSGATASFNPTSVTAGSSSTLTVNAGTAAPGTYPLTVTGTGSPAVHSTPISVTVTGP